MRNLEPVSLYYEICLNMWNKFVKNAPPKVNRTIAKQKKIMNIQNKLIGVANGGANGGVSYEDAESLRLELSKLTSAEWYAVNLEWASAPTTYEGYVYAYCCLIATSFEKLTCMWVYGRVVVDCRTKHLEFSNLIRRSEVHLAKWDK